MCTGPHQYLHILLTAEDFRQQQEHTQGTGLALQVYAVYFKANRQLIREYENLRNYTAEIYQMPGMQKAASAAAFPCCCIAILCSSVGKVFMLPQHMSLLLGNVLLSQ